MTAPDPFDLISCAVDVNDPAEHELAQRFMLTALGRVYRSLPPSARFAATLADHHLGGTATAQALLDERAALGRECESRAGLQETDRLRMRATICVMHGMDVEAPSARLALFLSLWEQSGLSMVELEKARFYAFGFAPGLPGPAAA